MKLKVPTANHVLPHSQAYKDATATLMLLAPFFASLLLRYKHVATDTVPMLAVGVKTLLYNPKFLDSLPAQGRVAAFAHEVLHGVFQHVAMQAEYYRSKIGPDGKAFDPATWAKAIDYCVNGQVKEAGVGEVQPTWYCDVKRFPTTMTPQEIYVALRQEQGQGQQQGQGQPDGLGEGEGETLDQHGLAEDDDVIDGDGEPAITTGAVINAARVAKALGGKVPGAVQRLVESITRPPADPWRVLRKRIADIASGTDTTSCRKLNRKLIVRGIGAPGRTGYRLGNVGVVLDLSGSIGQAELNLFGGHLSSILQDYKPREVRIAWTDTHVHRLDTVRDMGALKSAFARPVSAGGGTDLEAAYDDLGRCDVVIVFTDGYTPFRKRPKFPVIWAMTTDVVAPYGFTLPIAAN